MSYDDRFGEGLDYFGCDELGAAVAPIPAGVMPLTTQPTPIFPNAVIAPLQVSPSPLPALKDWAKDKADKVKAKVDNLPVALGVGGAAGSAVGAGLGIWLIRAHRLFGGLGGLIAGAGAGMAAGYGVMKITGKGTGKVGDAKGGKGKGKKS